mgnify:CR=1 FL=1
MKNKALMGYLSIAVAALIFSTQGIISSVLLSYDIEPLSLAFFKTFFGAICLALMMVPLRRKDFQIRRHDLPRFVVYGIVGVALFSYFFFGAIEATNVTTAITLMYTAPAFTVIFARFVLGEMVTLRKGAAIFLTLAGTLLVIVGYDTTALAFHPRGFIMGILVGVCYGVYNVLSKKYVQIYSVWTVNFYSVLFAAIFLGLLKNPVPLIMSGEIPPAGWLFVVLLSFLTYGVAYMFFIYGFRHVEAGRGSIIANIEPVGSVILAAIFLKESMSLIQMAGFILVVTSIFLATREEPAVHDEQVSDPLEKTLVYKNEVR